MEEELLWLQEDKKQREQWLRQRVQRRQVTYIIFYHDESAIHKLERVNRGWMRDGVRAFLPKSKGTTFNISDFVSAWDGRLQHDGESACVIHRVGGDSSRGEYYWDHTKFLSQCENAIKIFNKKFSLDTVEKQELVRPVFIFDNAAIHTKRAENALLAHHMNEGSGIYTFIFIPFRSKS